MSIDMASFLRAALFLGVPFVLLVFFLQWRWARVCSNNIQVLVAQLSGGGKYELAPKEGGQVTIYNPHTDETRTWPINELATIEIPYPGVGFVPKFLQKTIRLAIVNEGDWEPMLNRSAHHDKIASPDVVEFLRKVAENNPNLSTDINKFLDGVSTGPTREMVADPTMLGNLMRSSVLKALASVSNDLMDTLKSINTRLGRYAGLNGTIIYIGLGLIIILQIVVLVQVMRGGGDADLIEKVDSIRRALGVQ